MLYLLKKPDLVKIPKFDQHFVTGGQVEGLGAGGRVEVGAEVEAVHT